MTRILLLLALLINTNLYAACPVIQADGSCKKVKSTEDCKKKISHCEICANQSTCQECESGYKKENGGKKCSLTCIPNCDVCKTKKVCSTCLAGYDKSSDGTKCTMQCPVNCICDKPNNCIGCKSAEYVLENNICKLKKQAPDCNVTYCSKCKDNNPNLCEVCQSGYKLPPITYQCRCSCPKNNKMPPNSSDYGAPCRDTFYLNATSDSNCVNVCGPGVPPGGTAVLIENKDQSKCIVDCLDPNCASCSIQEQCDTCQSGFSNKNGTCIPCNIDGCKKCDKDNVCASCNDGYYNYNGKCIPCNIERCTVCTTPNVCAKCEPATEYMPNPDDGGKSCIMQCNVNNCITCNKPNYCAKCESEYALSNGQCTKRRKAWMLNCTIKYSYPSYPSPVTETSNVYLIAGDYIDVPENSNQLDMEPYALDSIYQDSCGTSFIYNSYIKGSLASDSSIGCFYKSQSKTFTARHRLLSFPRTAGYFTPGNKIAIGGFTNKACGPTNEETKYEIICPNDINAREAGFLSDNPEDCIPQ